MDRPDPVMRRGSRGPLAAVAGFVLEAVPIAVLGLVFAAVPAAALAQDEAPPEEEAAPAAGDQAGEAEPGEPAGTVEEVLVVTASRAEQSLHDAPASMTVLSAADIEAIPTDDYGDLLRNVPGLNVSQMSARDIQLTGRGATSSLATSELVLLDGRTLYLDFFGFVMWDFLPVNPAEIKQIEVVRGPGSAVWGANALSGVINLITKSPAEMAGTSLLLGAGDLGTAFGSVTHAGVSGPWGYKLSGGYYEQDPFPRPTGLIPGTTTPYPAFENEGTAQPKADVRFDYDAGGSLWTFGGGYAGTDGIIHSGIGPFDIDSGSSLSYAKAGYNRGTLQVNAFANVLDGDADNLLTRGPDGRPIPLEFATETFDLSLTHSVAVAGKHLVTWGANARTSEFDLSIAPLGESRDELGAFLQAELALGERVRWLLGSRVDDIDPIGTVVSPRTSLMISPNPDHTFRLSYNQAFRAPSVVNNFLDITILNLVVLPPIPPLTQTPTPFVFASAVDGNPRLDEEQLDAFEVGYTGTFGNGVTVTAAAYRNETADSIDFFTAATYGAADPPAGWPFPPFLLAFPPPNGFAGVFPSQFSYRNIGETIDRGVEVSFQQRPTAEWSWFLNYSWQDEPEVTGVPIDEVNLPPENRANVSVAYDTGRWFVNGNLNYQDEAFWTDVLDSRFHGPTDSFTQLNLGAGVRFAGDRVTLSVQAQNVTDEEIQQHVFGDILERKVIGQVRFEF